MKRGRGVSNAVRTLSSATAQGIISNEQKLWLRSVLSEGDPAVEEALDQAALGNSQPLKDLASKGEGSLSLRARLQTLSRDDSFQRLSFSRTQSRELGPSSSQTPNILDLEMLADDLRLSSLSDVDTGDDVLNLNGGDEGDGVDNGFDLEALLDEVTGMMTATAPTNQSLNTLQEEGSFDNNQHTLSSDLELDFNFTHNYNAGSDYDGSEKHSRHSSIDGDHHNGDVASMISSSSDGGGGPRGNLSIRGSLLLAQMRARESFTGHQGERGTSRSLNDTSQMGQNQMSRINDMEGNQGNLGINMAIIDDYFVDDSVTTSRGTDLDSIDRNMLAVLAQDDLSPLPNTQNNAFNGFGYPPQSSSNQMWSIEEPPPPTGPFTQGQSPSSSATQGQPFFMFGSCTTGANNQPQQAHWNPPPVNGNGVNAPPMMVPPYGSPPSQMNQGGAASSTQGAWPATWSPGMDPLHVMQMQHRAQMMRRNGAAQTDNHFVSHNRDISQFQSNQRGNIRANELCLRLDGLRSRVHITPQQRELVFIILNRDDKFLTKQFDSAIQDAEKGKTDLLIDLISKAETMSSHLKEVGNLSSSASVKSNGSEKSNNSSTTPKGTVVEGGGGIGGALLKNPADDEALEFQSTLASASAASASLDKALIEEHIRILDSLVLKRKASAVRLRDLKVLDGALKVMKELKQVQAVLDILKARLIVASASNTS